MQKSAEIAQSMSALMQVEQLQGVSQQFSQELMKVITRIRYELSITLRNLDGRSG